VLGEGSLPNWNLSLTCLFRIMKYQTVAFIGLLLVTSCGHRPNFNQPTHDPVRARTNEVLKTQEAIAREIPSIEYAFADAMFHTNAIVIVADLQPLVDRLEKISKELDALGPFPDGLREATTKKLIDVDKNLYRLSQSKKPGPLQPETAKVIDPVVDRYFSAWASVMMKAGLEIKAEKEGVW
jgi:hypothetical protein